MKKEFKAMMKDNIYNAHSWGGKFNPMSLSWRKPKTIMQKQNFPKSHKINISYIFPEKVSGWLFGLWYKMKTIKIPEEDDFELDDSNLIKKPFVSYTLDEDKKKTRDIFSISLNQEEREWLDGLKKDLDVKSDGQALKLGALIGKNVLQALFTRPFLRYLFRKERKRFDDI